MTATQTVFVLSAAGLANAAFTTLRAWLDLRKSRSVSLEIGSGKTKRKISLKAMDFDDLPRKVQELIVAEDAKAPSKKDDRKAAVTQPAASPKSKAKRLAKKVVQWPPGRQPPYLRMYLDNLV